MYNPKLNIFSSSEPEPESDPFQECRSLVVSLPIKTPSPSPNLPAGVLLHSTNFVSWKIRVDEMLRSLGLITDDDEVVPTPQSAACSLHAAKHVRLLVQPSLLREVPFEDQVDRRRLLRSLQNVCFRFRFMELPPEVRSRVYAHLIDENATIYVAPAQDNMTGYPPITEVSRQTRLETLPLLYSRCTFMLSFKAGFVWEGSVEEASANVPYNARRWAKRLSSQHVKHLREITMTFRVRSSIDVNRGSFTVLDLKFSPEQGLALVLPATFRLTDESKMLLIKHIGEIEETRRMLGLQGESIIMAITGKEDVWKYGTPKCLQ